MTYLLLAIGLVVFIGLFGVCVMALIEWEQPVLAVVGFVLLIAFGFWVVDGSNKYANPCARYETQMMYNV